jgi:hypothetical protein
MKQHDKSNWLVIFLTTLVGIWLLQQVFNHAIHMLHMYMIENQPFESFVAIAITTNLLRSMSTFVTFVALVVVISLLRKWRVLWPIPAFYVLNLVWVRLVGFLSVVYTNFMIIGVPIGSLLLYFTAAALTFLLVRKHNQPSTQEQTMST